MHCIHVSNCQIEHFGDVCKVKYLHVSIFIFQMDLKDAKLEWHVMSSKVEMYSDHFHRDVVFCMHLQL